MKAYYGTENEVREVVVMRTQRRSWKFTELLFSLLVVNACSAPAQTPLKTVNSPEGGRIMYGVVDGASSQAGGMASVLRAVHSSCGERPQVGRVFQFRGSWRKPMTRAAGMNLPEHQHA